MMQFDLYMFSQLSLLGVRLHALVARATGENPGGEGRSLHRKLCGAFLSQGGTGERREYRRNCCKNDPHYQGSKTGILRCHRSVRLIVRSVLLFSSKVDYIIFCALNRCKVLHPLECQ